MKIIRLTEDRYVIDCGPDVRRDQVEEIQRFWERWFSDHLTHPTAFTYGGTTVPVEYEDRRTPDIEERLAALEAAVIHHNHT